MLSQRFRFYVCLLLVFAILNMVGPRAALALPMGMGMVEMTHQMDSPHGRMQVADDMSSRHAIAQSGPHNGHQNMCGCAVPCSFCGVCHATVPVGSVSGFGDRLTAPSGPFFLLLAEVTIPLDPPPPRV